MVSIPFFLFLNAALHLRDAIDVVVQLDVDRITTHDPLLVKTRAVNQASIALSFDPPLSVLEWNLEYEVLHPSAAQFRRVEFLRTDRPNRFPHPRGFEASAAHVSYDYLFQSRSSGHASYVFPDPGIWAIRAKVIAGSMTYTSKPVTVTVVEATRATQLAQYHCQKELASYVQSHGFYSTTADIDRMARIANEVGRTNTQRLIHCAVLIKAVQQAKSQQELDAAITSVRDFRQQSSLVQREHVDLLLTKALIDRRDLLAATRQFKAIDESSELQRSVHSLLKRLENK